MRQDPQRAVELIAKLGSGEDAQLFTPVLAAEWANRDARAAARWVASAPRERNAMSAYIVAPIYAARFPRREALEWASRIDRSRNGAVWSQALAGLAEADPDMALQLAAAVPEPGRRSQALMTVVVAIARRDPTLAMRYYESSPLVKVSFARSPVTIATRRRRRIPVAPSRGRLASVTGRRARWPTATIGEQLARRDVTVATGADGRDSR